MLELILIPSTVDEFKQVGETKAFVRLIQQGFEVNQLLLFKLYGALQHKYIYMLSLEEKKRLLEQADSALYDAGLRKRFTV
ncbi:TfoX/Sxy family DNA transformation protein [[Haemophilus] ducreyi]|uniref:TfoX/Sxy family DNA transformation protein n=1 Tax=Haemophilus ducreyi TaxID=730 RepID=UPI001E6503C0|nr:TfoX/Sxy family DNA transformation protein [[Haemophilus] ducreyi]